MTGFSAKMDIVIMNSTHIRWLEIGLALKAALHGSPIRRGSCYYMGIHTRLQAWRRGESPSKSTQIPASKNRVVCKHMRPRDANCHESPAETVSITDLEPAINYDCAYLSNAPRTQTLNRTPPATSTSNQPGTYGHWNQPKTKQDEIGMGLVDDFDASAHPRVISEDFSFVLVSSA